MAGLLRNVTTLNGYLADRKWLFHERGMMFVWNELQVLFNAALAGAGAVMPTGVDTIGEAVLTTNIGPGDFIERGNATGRTDPLTAGAILEPPTQSIAPTTVAV